MIPQSHLDNWKPPTDGQKQAGNYFKPRLFIAGLEIAIENPAGTVRTGQNEDGTQWLTKMQCHYGYVVGSKGSDGDEVDVYIGPNPDSQHVFVVHQAKYNDWDNYDEDKAMICFDSQTDAEQAYLAHYDDVRFMGVISAMSLDKFKRKVLSSDGNMIKSQLLDLSGLSCGCADHALEELSKAISEDQHDIWEPSNNVFISKLIELFTEKGLLRTEKINTALNGILSGVYKPIGAKPENIPGMMAQWNPVEMDVVRLYIESIPEGAWTLDDYGYLIEYLFQRYLPKAELISDAEWLVTKSHLMGKAQAAIENIATSAAIDGVVNALPATIQAANKLFNFASAEKQIMDYARLKSMDLVVSMSDANKHALKTTLLDHMHKKFSGDVTATPGKLQQSLHDNFSQLNRDFRRIALTESNESFGQGFIASLPVGAKVKRIEQYRGACSWCKKIDGKIMNVVSADDPNKDGDTSVWPGKTNYGRSSSPYRKTEDGMVKRDKSELWWVAAGAQHPHCRGRWVTQTAHEYAVNDEFTQWFKQHVGDK